MPACLWMLAESPASLSAPGPGGARLDSLDGAKQLFVEEEERGAKQFIRSDRSPGRSCMPHM